MREEELRVARETGWANWSEDPNTKEYFNETLGIPQPGRPAASARGAAPIAERGGKVWIAAQCAETFDTIRKGVLEKWVQSEDGENFNKDPKLLLEIFDVFTYEYLAQNMANPKQVVGSEAARRFRNRSHQPIANQYSGNRAQRESLPRAGGARGEHQRRRGRRGRGR